MKRLIIKALRSRAMLVFIMMCLLSGIMTYKKAILNLFPRRALRNLGIKGRTGPLFPHLSQRGLPTFMDHGPHILPGDNPMPPWVQAMHHAADTATNRTRTPKTRKARKSMPWKQHIREVCDDQGIPWHRGNFQPGMLKNIVVDDTHKVLFCPIPKVACTTWVRIMLALTGKIKMEDTFKLRSGEIHSRWGLLNYLHHYSREEVLDRLKNYYKFVVVRDPYERILSAYRNKFERPDNLTGFHFVYGKPIVRRYRNGIPWKRIPLQQRYRPTFTEYIQYLSDSENNIRTNNHWDKFYMVCHPCIVHYDFVANMADLEKDGNKVLKAIGVSDKLKMPPRVELGYHHKKTENVMAKYFNNISDSLMDALYSQYRFDYDIFNLTYKEPKTV